MGHLSETNLLYLYKSSGVEEGGGHIFEGGLLAGDYVTVQCMCTGTQAQLCTNMYIHVCLHQYPFLHYPHLPSVGLQEGSHGHNLLQLRRRPHHSGTVPGASHGTRDPLPGGSVVRSYTVDRHMCIPPRYLPGCGKQLDSVFVCCFLLPLRGLPQ